MKVGEQKHGNIYLRCPFCGDSATHPEEAHWGVHTEKFIHHCYLCGAGGKLSLSQALNLLGLISGVSGHARAKITVEDLETQLLPGAGTSRRSALRRHHIGESDVFELRDPIDGEMVGYLVRHPPSSGRKAQVVGIRGLAFVESAWPFTSSPNDPLRLVEGPYDVLSSRDIALGGTINQAALKDFRGHFLILCPDGDVWQKQSLLKQMIKLLDTYTRAPQHLPSIVAIEYIEDGKDPDITPVADRLSIPSSEFRDLLKALKERYDAL